MPTKHEQYKKLLTDARAIAVKADEEGRDFTSDEREKVAQMLADARDRKSVV